MDAEPISLTARLELAFPAGAEAPPFRLDLALVVPVGITVLLGASGAGKSSTLSAIAGLLAPNGGRITLGSELWFDRAARIDRPAHQRRLGYVFQSPALFPHMSALDNVGFGLARGTTKEVSRAQALAWLERLEVAHLAERRPASYSGGEAQRVALARALAREPGLLLLDEAFSGLDPGLRNALGQVLKQHVTDRRLPCIFVTHLTREAEAIGDRALLLQAGRVSAQGSVAEVLAQAEW